MWLCNDNHGEIFELIGLFIYLFILFFEFGFMSYDTLLSDQTEANLYLADTLRFLNIVVVPSTNTPLIIKRKRIILTTSQPVITIITIIYCVFGVESVTTNFKVIVVTRRQTDHATSRQAQFTQWYEGFLVVYWRTNGRFELTFVIPVGLFPWHIRHIL